MEKKYAEKTEVVAGITVRRKAHADLKDHLVFHEKGGLVWMSAPNLDGQSWLHHGFTTRLGGVSEGDIGTMNLSFTRGDKEENVRENYRRIAEAVGFDPEKLVLTHQTHTANIRIVGKEDAGKGYAKERGYTDVDGLVTNEPGLTLACYGSDCVQLLAADPVRKVIGCAHSGWRGTISDIGGNLVRTMASNFGSDPSDILTVVGPSICGDCYEVSADVADVFTETYPANVHARLLRRKENGKYQLDLWEACALNFERAGVDPGHICVTDLCTRCNPDLLFSHRIQKGRQTNLAALISIV